MTIVTNIILIIIIFTFFIAIIIIICIMKIVFMFIIIIIRVTSFNTIIVVNVLTNICVGYRKEFGLMIYLIIRNNDKQTATLKFKMKFTKNKNRMGIKDIIWIIEKINSTKTLRHYNPHFTTKLFSLPLTFRIKIQTGHEIIRNSWRTSYYGRSVFEMSFVLAFELGAALPCVKEELRFILPWNPSSSNC